MVETPAALRRLRAHGLRGVPVVASVDRERRFVYGQDLAQVADLVGIDYRPPPALAPGVLLERWVRILRAALRYAAQIPPARLGDELPGRPRSYLSLANHVVEIAAGYLAVARGADFDGSVATAEVVPPRGMTELFARAAEVIRDLEAAAEDNWNRVVATYYGPQTLHAVLERCTWHSAQHVRQLQLVLSRLRIEPDGPLDDAAFAGLPMPEDAWDPA